MVVAIGLGVALAAALLLVNQALVASLEESLAALMGKADLRVVGRGRSVLEESLVKAIQAVPGVAVAAPLVMATAFPDDESGELLNVYGVDMLSDAAVRLYQVRGENGSHMEDPLVFLSHPDSVMATMDFMRTRKLQLNDRLTLVTPSGVRRFTIRGVLPSTDMGRAVGGRLIVMDTYAAQEAFLGEKQITQIDIILHGSVNPSAVAKDIARALPEGASVETVGLQREDVSRLVHGFRLIVDALSVVVLLVSFLITFNRLSTLFLGRLWEVGVSRALAEPVNENETVGFGI